MKKVAESCQPTTKSSTAGNTSQTGTNVLNREVINRPANEERIRGMTFTREDLHQAHKDSIPLLPYVIVEEALVRRGVVIEEAI